MDIDRPLTPKEHKFARLYVDNRERYALPKIAQLAGLRAREGKVLFDRPTVRAEIERRLSVIELEQSKLKAMQQHLTDSLLDEELANLIRLKPTDLEGAGTLKLAAIRLAFLVRGRIRDGNSEALFPKDAPENQSNGAVVYRTMFAEQTVTRQEPASQVGLIEAPLPPPKPPTIEAQTVRVY